tara:strand:+ start:5535 stop:6365 length:831 start_codon:yes stop_codon:yes gene_type:complete
VINNITVIIVSYKSKKTIFNCLKSLERFNKILILDNSNDKELKRNIKKKNSKIKFFLSKKNSGYGAGYNFLLKQVETPYALLMTPDTSFKKGSLNKFLYSIKNFPYDYCLMGPYKQNKKFALENKKKVSKAKLILGFSMLINIKNINKNKFFDENIFLYLEDIDLCKRLMKSDQKIYINKSFEIHHSGAKSSNLGEKEFDQLRNWHWMWSQYYFFKKYNGNFLAFTKFFSKLVIILLKYSILFLLQNENQNRYKYRAKGLFSSMIGKKSYLRPNKH